MVSDHTQKALLVLHDLAQQALQQAGAEMGMRGWVGEGMRCANKRQHIVLLHMLSVSPPTSDLHGEAPPAWPFLQCWLVATTHSMQDPYVVVSSTFPPPPHPVPSAALPPPDRHLDGLARGVAGA